VVNCASYEAAERLLEREQGNSENVTSTSKRCTCCFISSFLLIYRMKHRHTWNY
jgi:hypothetical protein